MTRDSAIMLMTSHTRWCPSQRLSLGFVSDSTNCDAMSTRQKQKEIMFRIIVKIVA